MNEIVLDGTLMQSREAMHDALASAFALPAHYGRNLDALYDCLSERREGAPIVLESPERMPAALYTPLVTLLLDLARTGAGWRFTLRSPAACPGRYRHFKGGEYECLGLALHSETLEPLVTYRALYASGGLWVRPAAMWAETVLHEGERVPRFSRIAEGG